MYSKRHSRTLTFIIKGPTNYNPSRVIINDRWKEKTYKLGLSGADVMATIEGWLEHRGHEIMSWGYTNSGATTGVILSDTFEEL